MAALLLMLLIFFWRRYGENFLSLHKVPDRYLGLLTAAMSIVYSLGLALAAAGAFNWHGFLSQASLTAGESMLAWEIAGKYALEATLGKSPTKTRREAVHAAGVAAVAVVAATTPVTAAETKPTVDDKPAA